MQQTLHTARLTMRPCAEADLAQLHQHWTKPEIRRYPWDDRIISQDTVREVLTASLASSQGHCQCVCMISVLPLACALGRRRMTSGGASSRPVAS